MKTAWELYFPSQRRVLLVRHGQAAGNVKHGFLGRKDDPLTELGQQQALTMAKHLANEPIKTIYTSPLKRAAATAQAIADQLGQQSVIDDRLMEQDFGQWDGLTLDTVAKTFPEDFARRPSMGSNFAPTGGESLAQVCGRVRAFSAELNERYQAGETIVIVGHAGVFQAILCTWFNLELGPTWPFKLLNGTLTEVQFRENRPVLSKLSETPPN